jgi:hypothetical protein
LIKKILVAGLIFDVGFMKKPSSFLPQSGNSNWQDGRLVAPTGE